VGNVSCRKAAKAPRRASDSITSAGEEAADISASAHEGAGHDVDLWGWRGRRRIASVWLFFLSP